MDGNHVYVNVVNNVDCVGKHAWLIFITTCHFILWTSVSIAKTVHEIKILVHFSHISYLDSLSPCKRGMNYKKKHKRDLHHTITRPSTQL